MHGVMITSAVSVDQIMQIAREMQAAGAILQDQEQHTLWILTRQMLVESDWALSQERSMQLLSVETPTT